MALLVQKFGGTSVGSVERSQAVAQRIARCREEGHDVVVVVSAMGHTTDELTGLAAAITADPPRREMDMLLASGEQVSIALLAMALNALGVSAVSMTGPQVGIVTESTHGRARILEIRTDRVQGRLADGSVVPAAEVPPGTALADGGIMPVSNDPEATVTLADGRVVRAKDAPPGAKLPSRIAMWPVAFTGCAKVPMTRCPSERPGNASRFSAMVFPVTVRQSPCK